MKKWTVRAAILILIVVAGWFGWRFFFPNQEMVIRKRLAELAQTASFTPAESPFAKLSNTQHLMGYCTSDIEILLDSPNLGRQTLSGRDELQQRTLAMRQYLSAFSVELVDVNVMLGSDRKSAIAELTARGKIPGDSDLFVQELRFTLKKIGGDWLIRKIEPVKTLR